MRFILGLIATFIVACFGWTMIHNGGLGIAGGVALLGACYVFAIWTSINAGFGSMKEMIASWRTML